MEFSIAKNILSEALSIVSSVVPERSARIDLQNLLLIGNADNTITLGATDLEIGVKITIAVNEMKNPSTILLPASRLSALIKGLSEDIHFTIVDGKAEIKTAQDKFDLAGSDSEGYPAIPEFKGEGTVFIHGDDFIEAVQKTVFATAKGDTRYSLNGIYIDIDGTKADFVASDTHRLALVKKKVKNPDNVVCSGIVQTKGMTTLSRLAAGQDLVELKITQNEMLAKTTNAVVYIRLVDGFFPRYKEVIPEKSESRVTFNREEMVRRLHNVGLMASDETRAVLFDIGGNTITISASSDNGQGKSVLDSVIEGGDACIKFNYSFVIDALKNMSDEKAVLQYKDSENPARLDDGDFMYVIMPINK